MIVIFNLNFFMCFVSNKIVKNLKVFIGMDFENPLACESKWYILSSPLS
jgi:hypothetical protein